MKKKILVINPNTSEAMTEDIRKTVESMQSPQVQAVVRHPDFGPVSIESKYDETIAGYAMLQMLESGGTAYDGILVACYGDPGLYAVKEKMSCPVIGIAEASISASVLLGYRFSILAAGARAVPLMNHMVRGYGMLERLASIECLDMAVTDVEADKDTAVRGLTDAALRAKQKGAEVCILGCAGMTGLGDEVAARTGVSIMDPLAVGYGMLESFVLHGITVSKSGYFAPLPEKAFLSEQK